MKVCLVGLSFWHFTVDIWCGAIWYFVCRVHMVCQHKVKVPAIPVSKHCASDMVRYDLLYEASLEGVFDGCVYGDTDCAFAGGWS